MTPAHGASDGQDHDVEPSLLTSIGSRGIRMKEKKDPTILEAFLSLVLLIFLHYNTRFPLAYKRENRAPHEGDAKPIDPSRSDTDPRKSTTRTHS